MKDHVLLVARAWAAFRLPIFAALLIEVVGMMGYRILSEDSG